jgi:hypothetical protein
MSSGRLSKILIEGGRDNGKGEALEPSPEPLRPPGLPAARGPKAEGASLYDDTFSRAKPAGLWMKLALAAMLVAVGGAVILTIVRGPVDLRINLDSPGAEVVADLDLSGPPEAAGDPGPTGEDLSTPGAENPGATLSEQAARRDAEVAAPEASRAPSPPLVSESAARGPAVSGSRSVEPERVSPAERPLESPRPAGPGGTPARNTGGPAAESDETPDLPRFENIVPAEGGRDLVNLEPDVPQGGGESEILQLLVANSRAASRLVDGGFSTLVFRDWRVVQSTSQEVWVDLIAGWTSGGSDVHFIWSVDRDTGSVRPLSQAARNLEAGGESPR